MRLAAFFFNAAYIAYALASLIMFLMASHKRKIDNGGQRAIKLSFYLAVIGLVTISLSVVFSCLGDVSTTTLLIRVTNLFLAMVAVNNVADSYSKWPTLSNTEQEEQIEQARLQAIAKELEQNYPYTDSN
jgi:hypothetical protein